MSKYVIRSLYKDYFQKSRVFLYPVLAVKRGGRYIPKEMYMAWDGEYNHKDRRFICLYPEYEDPGFQKFEVEKLLDNSFFEDMFITDQGKVYVFDLNPMKEDWDRIIAGKYSTISEKFKKRILASFDKESSHFPYIESFLRPEEYMETYAKLLSMKVSRLREVGELCDPPNLEKETLFARKLVLNMPGDSLDLQKEK